VFLYWVHLVHNHGTEWLVALSQIVLFVWGKWVSVTIQLCHWNWVNPQSKVILKKLRVLQLLSEHECYRSSHMGAVLSQIIHNRKFTPFFYFFTTHISFNLSFIPTSYNMSLPPRTSEWHVACTYHLPIEHE